MVNITDYRLAEQGGFAFLFVISSETSSCPICGEILLMRGWRLRVMIDSGGNKTAIYIRRLFCSNCKHLHHELPNCLVPYKRNCSETIEAIISGQTEAAPCDKPLINRLKSWWKTVLPYFMAIIESLRHVHKIISPILSAMEEGADMAKIGLMKSEACGMAGISRKTLNRWLDRYAQTGFDGLKYRGASTKAGYKIPGELVKEAILLRLEVPSRSIPQIIEILEMEGKAPVGFLRRSTLQDRLREEGYSKAQMKLYQNSGTAARRFERSQRNDMWQADIKFGPSLKIKGVSVIRGTPELILRRRWHTNHLMRHLLAPFLRRNKRRKLLRSIFVRFQAYTQNVLQKPVGAAWL